MQTNYMLDEWLTMGVILTKKNAKLDENNRSVGVYTQGRMRSYKSANVGESQDKNALRCPMKMLNTLNLGSALP